MLVLIIFKLHLLNSQRFLTQLFYLLFLVITYHKFSECIFTSRLSKALFIVFTLFLHLNLQTGKYDDGVVRAACI